MSDIEEELEQKSIERENSKLEFNIIEEPEPEPETIIEPVEEKPKKSKKTRSPAQIAAFEKAKIKRQENLKLKREQKEQDKLDKKVLKEKVKEELTKPLVRQESTIPKPVINTPSSREQVIQNHYYYYGVPPPQDHYSKSKKKKKTKKPIVESSSEEESEEEEALRPPSPPLEPETFKELQNYQEPVQTYDKPKPRLKFAFA